MSFNKKKLIENSTEVVAMIGGYAAGKLASKAIDKIVAKSAPTFYANKNYTLIKGGGMVATGIVGNSFADDFIKGNDQVKKIVKAALKGLGVAGGQHLLTATIPSLAGVEAAPVNVPSLIAQTRTIPALPVSFSPASYPNVSSKPIIDNIAR